jgi:hypothetical protein
VSGVPPDQLKAEEGILDEIEGKKATAKPNHPKPEIKPAAVEDGPKDIAAVEQKLTPAKVPSP